jgi:single-strand DNA-binding protein
VETYITVAGNLVADPKVRTVANGQAVADLRIASNSRRFDREAGEFKDGDPLYIGVSCWRTLALNVYSSLRKGDSVVVQGKLLYKEYDDKEGVHRNAYSIDATSIGPDLSRWPVDVRRPNRPTETEPATAAVAEREAPAPAGSDPVAA